MSKHVVRPRHAGKDAPREASRRPRTSLVAGMAGVLLFASLAAISVSQVAASGGDPTVTTSTGVVTHGAITTTPNNVGWLLRCDYSHSSHDDPIMMPDMMGMSHLHDFFGNTSTIADSTVPSMEASATTCGTGADTAGYWAPALFVNGKIVSPNQTRQQIYYRFKYAPGTKVVPMPQDLRLVVGNPKATFVADNPALADAASGGRGIYWECDGNTAVHYAAPPSCSTGVVVENVQFPSCWDGQLNHGVGSLNDNEHLTNTPNFGSCPAKFPIALPRISLKVKYVIGTKGNAVTLGSGPAASAHADFWNTWQPQGLRYLVDKCINAGISCGTNPIAPMG